MKKTSSIRLFFVLCTLGCCVAYCGGYYYSIQKSEKIYEQEPADAVTQEQASVTGEIDQSMESAAVVKPYEYLLCESDGFVVVYYSDKTTVYAETDILIDLLPYNLQKEIESGKPIYSETELYNFLESHSS